MTSPVQFPGKAQRKIKTVSKPKGLIGMYETTVIPFVFYKGKRLLPAP